MPCAAWQTQVPPTRSDILHACDVVEDVAIAHGYNNIPKRVRAASMALLSGPARSHRQRAACFDPHDSLVTAQTVAEGGADMVGTLRKSTHPVLWPC